MAKQTINIGSSANDGTGDALRTAFTKANDNFTELYNRADIPSQSGQGGKYLTTTGTTLGWGALGAAAVSNSYDDLDDLPTLGAAATSNSYNDLDDLPSIPTAASLSVDDLITLSGVATGAVNLGTFTGATIGDNLTIKAALQALETVLETKLPTTSYTAADVLTKLLTVDGASSTLDADLLDGEQGSHYLDYTNFTNTPTIPTASSLSVDDLITLSGVAEGATTLGAFTGSTITDDQTIKSALQELETAVEGKQNSITTTLTLTASTSAPTVSAGTFAVADGTSWDPASKAGAVPYPVFYDGVSWTALY